jgi:HlyD family secretion protein
MDTGTHIATAQASAVKRKPARRRTRIGVIIAAILLATLLWLLFGPEPISIELSSVTQGPMQVTIDNQGQVRVHDKYVVGAPVAAELQRVDLHDGDAVRRGQIVAILAPLPMDTRQRQEARARLDAARALSGEAGLLVRRAQADMQFATNERARIERLVAGKFVSPQALDKAVSTENAARSTWAAAVARERAASADVKAAEAALFAAGNPGERRVVPLASPVDGYVLKVNEKSTRTVAAGTPLVTIGDPGRYEIVVDVLSTDAVKIKPGNLMLLEGWGDGKSLRAKVRLVEPVAFTKISALGVEEQRVNVIADPVDALGPLGDGYRIEARIVVWSGENVVKVAGSSLFRVGQSWHVFAAEHGRAKEREVQVGQRNQDEAQILSGLAPGEAVIRYPNNQIDDGIRITSSKDRPTQ